jgi:hypothetical protein
VELIAAHTGSAANALFTYDALSGDGDDDDNDGPTTQSIAQVNSNHSVALCLSVIINML